MAAKNDFRKEVNRLIFQAVLSDELDDALETYFSHQAQQMPLERLEEMRASGSPVPEDLEADATLAAVPGVEPLPTEAPHQAPPSNKPSKLPVSQLAFYDVAAKKWVVEAGDYELRAGKGSQDQLAALPVTITGP